MTDRLLVGALDVVAEQGLDRFNVDALATATRAGKAAIYRRWPNIELLLADALRRCRPVPAVPDTGSLRGDLVALLEPLTRELDRDEFALAAVLGRGRYSAEVRAGLEFAVVEPLAAAVTVIVDREGERGRGVSARQLALLCRLVRALWWERYVVGSQVSNSAAVEELVDRALLPLVGGA